MKNQLLPKILYTFLAVLLLSGCESDVNLITEEPVKDITGTWKIVRLTRNGEDLTERLDLSKFRIIFNADGTYTLQNGMAFVVSEPGTYELGDPQFLFSLTLTPQNQPEEEIKLQFPVINGKRQLSLTLSPGCTSNVYQYNLERETQK